MKKVVKMEDLLDNIDMIKETEEIDLDLLIEICRSIAQPKEEKKVILAN